jgi:ribonuclease-3
VGTNLNVLEDRIGYHFKDQSLLLLALTHTSYANESHQDKTAHNERIEFLGDAVLELISSEYFYHNMPTSTEGEMTKRRASMVCEPTLAFCARQFGLEQFIRLGKGEEHTGGRGRDSITSDALESLIGAIYLDGGFASAKEFVLKFVLNDMEHKQFFYDSKTILQEKVQARFSQELTYESLGEEGPDHDKRFHMQVRVGTRVLGEGTGRTKKAAQQMAAYQALLLLQKED